MSPQEPTISAYLTKAALCAALSGKTQQQKALEAAGIDKAVLDEPEARLPLNAFARLFRNVENANKDPHLGMAMGKNLALYHPGGNILFNMMANCPDLGAALEKFFLYHDIMADALIPGMIRDKNLARLSWDLKTPVQDMPRAFDEALLCVFLHTLKLLTQGEFTPFETRFSHSRPEDTVPHETVFGKNLAFGCAKSELVLETLWLEKPLALANPDLLEAMEQFAHQMLVRLYSRTEWTDKVIHCLGSRLVRGRPPDLASVARDLGVGQRSLQQRLKEEGAGFKKISSNVRMEMAKQRLKNGEEALCDIAFLLGFSDQSAFTNAFRKWTGMTPRMFRNRERCF